MGESFRTYGNIQKIEGSAYENSTLRPTECNHPRHTIGSAKLKGNDLIRRQSHSCNPVDMTESSGTMVYEAVNRGALIESLNLNS